MVKLGDVCGVNPPKKQIIDILEGKKVSFIPMSSVSEDGNIDVNEIRDYSEVSNGFSYFKENDVLFAKITPCMENGKGAIASRLFNGVGVGSTEFHILRPDENYIISEWVYRYLSFSKVRKLAEKSMTGSAGQKRVPKTFLENLKIPLPPLEIQKYIANILDKTQEIIDDHKNQLEELDYLIKAIFYDMFGDLVLNEKNWKVSTVEKSCKDIYGGGTPSKSKPEYYVGNIPWVTPKDMKAISITDSIDHINEDAINNSSAKLVPANSILMVIRSGILKKTLPVAINKVDVAMNQDMKAFVVNDTVNPEYLLYYFIMTQSNILKNVRSVTADNIEFRLIKNASLPLPQIELQNKFAQIVTEIEEQKSIVKQSITESQTLFNSLMSKYFDQ